MISHCPFVFFGPVLRLLFQHDFSSGVEDPIGIREQIRSLQRQNHGALIVCTNSMSVGNILIDLDREVTPCPKPRRDPDK